MYETMTKEELSVLIKSNAEFKGGEVEGNTFQNTTHAKAKMGATGASVPLAVSKRTILSGGRR